MTKLTIGFALLTAIIFAATTNIYIGLAVFLALIRLSLCEIPNQPLTKGIVNFLGKPLNMVIGPGKHLLLLCKLGLFGYIEVDATRQELESPMEIRTPDKIKSELTPFIWYAFDDEHPLEFLRANGFAGIEKDLRAIDEERTREWVRSRTHGPKTWEELQDAGEEAATVRLKALFGDEIPRIPFDGVPTGTLLRYFRVPRSAPTELERAEWGEKWEKLTNYLEGLLSPAELRALKTAVEERRKLINALRAGNGSLQKRNLGIKVERIGIKGIDPTGEFAEKVDDIAEAEIRQAAENVMLEGRRQQMEKFKETLGNPGQARDTVEVMTGVTKRTLTEQKISASHELVDGAKEVLLTLGKALLERRSEKGA